MGTILPGGDPSGFNKDSVLGLVENITTFALAIAGGIAIIMIIWGGIQYLTAYGNEEKATSGKKILTWSITGLIVVIMAEVIAYMIANLVSATPLP